MNILEFDEMNPRYREYCRAHGKSPASQWKGCRCLADVQEALMGPGYGPDNPKQDVHQLYNEWLKASVTKDLAAQQQEESA